MEWIKCSEQMPKEFEDVLVSDGNEVSWAYYYKAGEEVVVWGTYPHFPFCEDEITHWQPLPNPSQS